MNRSGLAGALLVFSLAGVSPADVINGSFEAYSGSGSSNIGAGLDGWTIDGGIDIVPPSLSNHWQAADGDVSISLNWFSPSSVSQTLATTAGQAYEVRFWMAAEIYGGPELRTLNVVWNGAIVGSPSFQYTGQGPAAMGWIEFAFVVQGSGLDTLTFASTTAGNFGPAIDDVSLVPVPAPAAAAVFALLGMCGGRRRRTR